MTSRKRWLGYFGSLAAQIAVVAALIVTAVVFFAMGAMFVGSESSQTVQSIAMSAGHDHSMDPAPMKSAETEQPNLLGYACAMNCVPPLPEPGDCPVCGMEMQPVYEESGGSKNDPQRTLSMSHEAMKLAEIETAPVEQRWVENQIRLVGTVDYDESRLQQASAYVGGRLDRMFVDFTGALVRKGDHMVEIYSPELLTAQQELLQALRALNNLSSNAPAAVRRSSRTALDAARERMRLWGMTETQIAEIEARGSARDRLTIYAPLGGIVIRKHVKEGDYVKAGEPIYTIADLSRVWVRMKAYENDLPWLRYGQDVIIESEAYPGDPIHGTIAFIDPILDPATRTADVRVNVDNSDGRSKPGMFVRAEVKSRLARGGKVIEPELAGKWICPMHPEIVKDSQENCDVCGMDLVPAEDLGYIAAAEDTPPLVIPDSAPLITGERAVVYVKDMAADRPTFVGREVTLGPHAGNYYLVADGLSEGERVVLNGAFKIDSALQIIARPSMMNPEGGVVSMGHEHHGIAPMIPASRPAPRPAIQLSADFIATLSPVYSAYFEVKSALASDALDEARSSFDTLSNRLVPFTQMRLEQSHAKHCFPAIQTLREAAQAGAESESIEAARAAFETASNAIIELHASAGHAGDVTFYKAFCPMAFDSQGAAWLQTDEAIQNPYFGESMLTCGKIQATWPPSNQAP